MVFDEETHVTAGANPAEDLRIEVSYAAYELQSERRLSRFAILVAAVAALIALWMAGVMHLALGLWLTGVCVMFGLYHALLVPRLLRSDRWLPHVRALNVTIEVTLPGIATLVDAYFLGGAFGLTSTPPLLTFLAVFGSGLRLRRLLSLYAGLMAALQFVIIFALVERGEVTPLGEQILSLHFGFAIQHALYLILAGALAALVATVERGMARRVVAQIRERQRISQLFGEYISPQAVNQVIAGEIPLAGEQRIVTVFFADVRDFTRLSFGADPAEVVTYLNAYFSKVCDVITAHHGMVNKFLGDGLLAVFGAPELDPAHARHALRAAQELVLTAASIPRPDGEPTRVGVGLHTGEVLIGSIGPRGRRDYTVTGDTVNVAARIEALKRNFDDDVLFTEAVREAAGDLTDVRDLGEHNVRGRDEPIRLYTIDTF